MDFQILGSGGCTVIPKPLCQCRVCKEARKKGFPYKRTGPSAFLHDINLLIDTPAEIACQLNRTSIKSIDYLIFTHFDPDHVEGFRIVEQITLDFRTWQAYPEKKIYLILPRPLMSYLKQIQSVYGPLIDYYEKQGFVQCLPFDEKIKIPDSGNDKEKIQITAIQIKHNDQLSYIYVFDKKAKKIVYAPCDIKPFPLDRKEVCNADLFVVQPGIFETKLKHGFSYPMDHISRTTLYTYEQTLALAAKIHAKRLVFVHLEEYWNRGFDQYAALEKDLNNVEFAYDNMRILI
ncbi:phosphoribosyl 1,2-cyclic phosphate phosphodiesterase [Candidatus Magnetomoraceae bacterium gMMP-15]